VPRRRSTDFLVVHATATPPSQKDYGVADARKYHVETLGWRDVGYHGIIKRDGVIERGRHIMEKGAHVSGYNHNSIGIAMAGGVDESNYAENNFTLQQWVSLGIFIADVRRIFPAIIVLGHRDLSPDTNGDGIISRFEWLKDCPCFTVSDIILQKPYSQEFFYDL